MPIASMTGFARAEGQTGGCSWVWEAKSVNARGLEVRCRLPQGWETLEPALRQQVASALKRGNVFIVLQIAWVGGAQSVRVNEEVLEQIVALVPRIESRLGQCRPSSAEGLLGLRGVMESVDPMPTGEARDALEAALLAGLRDVLTALVGVRRSEGERLVQALRDHLERLAELSKRARGLAAMQPEVILARLSQHLAQLQAEVPALPPERLAQEASLLAVKADPREELDRLRAHHQAADSLLRNGGAVGRQLDFLCQELNREANTLCSKSSDIELTRVGLDLKAVVEQVREQVQNIE
jgi:uncharacterized protein (TIGR00255 family)